MFLLTDTASGEAIIDIRKYPVYPPSQKFRSDTVFIQIFPRTSWMGCLYILEQLSKETKWIDKIFLLNWEREVQPHLTEITFKYINSFIYSLIMNSIILQCFRYEVDISVSKNVFICHKSLYLLTSFTKYFHIFTKYFHIFRYKVCIDLIKIKRSKERSCFWLH